MSIPIVSNGGGRIHLGTSLVAFGGCNTWIPANKFTFKASYFTDDGGCIDFSEDGLYLFLGYIYQTNHQYIRKYQLQKPFDVSTAGSTPIQTVVLNYARSNTFCIRDGGKKLFIMDEINDKIKRYDLSTAYDLSTTSQAQSVSAPGSYGYAVYITRDMKHILVCNAYRNGYIKCYSLSTAGDLSTMTLISTLNTTVLDEFADGFVIDETGKYMIIGGHPSSGSKIKSGELSTEWDVSTFTETGYISDRDGFPWYDGKGKLFVGRDKIYEYFI